MTKENFCFLFDGIFELFLEFIPLQVKDNIIRYERDDADEGGKAFVHAKAEADKKHGQQKYDRDEIGQDGSLVALTDGHFHVDFLVQCEVFILGSRHGEDFFGLLTHATGTLGMASGAGTLCQYLDFQFVVGDLSDDTFVGDGFSVFHAANLHFFLGSTKNHYFCKLIHFRIMSNNDKKDGKLKLWLQAKIQAAKEWYNRDDNFLRIIRFPGTKLPLMDVLIDFFKLFVKGRTVDRAAGVAFNFFVALFPLILFFFTLIPYIPIPHLYDRLMLALDDFLLPSGTLDYVKETIDGIMNQPHDGLLSISIVMCLVFGSNGIVAVFNGFRNVYADYLSPKKLGLKGWISQRMFAILMLIIIGALLVVSVLLISLGGKVLDRLVFNEIIAGGSFTFFLFNVLRWVIGVFALCFGIALLYYFGNKPFDEQYRVERKKTGPNGEKRYRDFVVFSPGSILAAALFVLGTVGFNTYISNFSRYNVLYGSIGTLIILMLWIWIVAILILAGNDLNSGIRRGTDKRSNAEDEFRRHEIVIEDLKKHINTYQAANEYRSDRIEELKKTIADTTVMIQNLEEQNRDYELIIQEYQKFAEQERKRSDEQYDKEFVLKEELEKLGNPS